MGARVFSLREISHAVQVAAKSVRKVSSETGEWIQLLLGDQHDEQHDGEDGKADAPAGAADRIVALEKSGKDATEQGLKHEHDATSDDGHEERLGVTIGPLLPDEVHAATDEAVAGELHDVQDEVQEAVHEVYEAVEAKADQILKDTEEGSDGSPDLRHGKQHREDQQDETDRSDRAIAVRLGRDTVHGRTMVHRRWRLLLRGSAVRLSLIRASAMRLRSAAV